MIIQKTKNQSFFITANIGSKTAMDLFEKGKYKDREALILQIMYLEKEGSNCIFELIYSNVFISL